MTTSRNSVVAISGLGSIAKQHARAFRTIPNVDVHAFEPSERLRDEAIASGLVERAHDDFGTLLATRPDALVIASPDAFHIEQLLAAVELGIPTLVEKPVAASLAEALDARERVRRSETPVLVGYVLRHRRVVQTVRELLASGTIGTPVSFQVLLGAYETITAAAHRFATAEPDRLYRDYSHEWDYVRWLLGPIEEVLAVARTVQGPVHIEAPNVVDGMLALENDIVGSFHIDYIDPRGTRTLSITGTNGTLVADIASGRLTVRRGGVGHDEVIEQLEAAHEPLTRQAQHLLDVARGSAQPRVSFADGVAALAVTDALIRSAENRAWTPVG